MEVRHERPDPDLSYRLRAPLTLGLPDGSSLPIMEWSLRGFSCAQLAGKPLEGLILSIPFQGVGVFFPVSVVAGDSDDEFLWQGMTGRQRETLALFYRNLMSGRMTSTQEMIVSLDTPVDLVPMEETGPEREAAVARVAPRPLRVVSSLVTYAVMFVLVFGFLAYVAMDRLNRVPVVSAKVAALSVPLIAQVPGNVTEALAEAGNLVEEGTPLIRLEDPNLRMARREGQQEIVTLTERVTLATARLDAHMAGRQNARATFRGGLDRFDAGVSLEPGDFHDLRKQLEADLAAAQAELALAEGRAETLEAQSDAMVIRAPARGAVLRYRDPLPGLAAQGERLATFEYDEPRAILAWVDPEQVAAVWPGMGATVRFNRNGRIYTIQARVAGMTMQNEGGDALIRLSLSLVGMEAGETRVWLEPDSPVEVQLKTDRLRRWLGLGLSDEE
jgi:multidrug resistance efflux pump